MTYNVKHSERLIASEVIFHSIGCILGPHFRLFTDTTGLTAVLKTNLMFQPIDEFLAIIKSFNYL